MGRALSRETISAVLEAYPPEGVVTWLAGWVAAEDDRSRTRKELGVIQEWSGEFADPERLNAREEE